MRHSTLTLLLTAFAQAIAAQSAFNYRCWWDDATVVQTGVAESATFEWELNAKDFTVGLHTLHVQVQETDGIWSIPVTVTFLKPSSLVELDKAWYWFDHQASSPISAPTTGIFEIDPSSLSPGLHTLHYQAVNKAEEKSPVTTSVIFKPSSLVELDKAWYWFDHQASTPISAPTTGIFEIDPSSLSPGLHILHYQAVNKAGEKSPVTTSVIFKPSSLVELDKAWYWFDRQTSTPISAPTTGIFEIDPSSLSPGLHTLNYQAVNKAGEKSPSSTTVIFKPSSEASLKTAHYWIDNADSEKKPVTAGENFEVDITGLKPGIHALHYQVENTEGEYSTPITDFFIVEHTAMGASVRLWIDEDEKSVRTLQMGKNEIELDVSEMEMGDHTIFLSIQNAQNQPFVIYSHPFLVYDLSRMGDVNADDETDVADIVQTVNYIIGKNPANFIFLRADINQDGNITVEDVVGIIRIIGGVTENGIASVKGLRLNTDDVLTASMHNRLLSIGLTEAQRYTAFQLTLTLPEGTDIEEATIALNRRAGHRVAYGNADQSHVTIVAYSIDGSTFLGENGSLLQLLMTELPEGDIAVDNILFVTPEGDTRHFAPFVIDSPTGIQQTSHSQMADKTIYDLVGRRLDQRPQKAGVYIQNGKIITVK